MERPVETYGKVIMPESGSRRTRLRKSAEKKENINFHSLRKTHTMEIALNVFLGFVFGAANVFGSFNPIGIGFVSAWFGSGAKFYMVSAAAFLGYAVMGEIYGAPMYMASVCAAILAELLIEKARLRLNVYLSAFVGCGCFLFGGIFMTAVNGGEMFLFVRIAAETGAVFALSVMFNNGMYILKNGFSRQILNDEKFLMAAAVVLVAICSVAGSGKFGFPAASFMGSYIMMAAGFSAGPAIACASGAVFAFCLIVMNGAPESVFIIFSISSILGGTFNGKKIFTAAAYMAGTVMTVFYMGDSMHVLLTAFAAAVLFVITPEKLFKGINTFANHEAEFNSDEYFVRLKKMTEQKLKAFAEAFGALAEAFENSELTNGITPKEAGTIIDDVSHKVCESCSMSLYCWRTKSFEVYGAIQHVIGEIETFGSINEKKLPVWLKNGCVRLSQLLEETNDSVKEYKNNMVWQNRINESRNILRQQLLSVEKIIGDLGGQVIQMPRFDESVSKELKFVLERKKLRIKSIFVSNREAMEIYITMKNCYGNDACKDIILPAAVKVTGRQFVVESDKCQIDRKGFCSVTLRENRGLVFETSISKEIKYGSEKTGDTAMSEEYGAKKAVMVLCDGMGSGEEAAKESLRAIDLTKRFVRAGFDLSLTLKVLNSALASGNGDMYTTLDVCSINLYTGQCEIIKNGGSTIFIYSCGEMRAIRSTSLPFGVVRDWEGEKTSVQIKSGDTVIMVTDGITEAFGIENEERAVALAVTQGGGNVDKISSLIVEAAKLADGGKAGDDMTVVVGRFI